LAGSGSPEFEVCGGNPSEDEPDLFAGDGSVNCRKRNFKTKPQAVKAIGQIEVLNMSKGQEKKNKGLHVYECEECKAWHVGHRINQNV
jgi:hypothetical protein